MNTKPVRVHIPEEGFLQQVKTLARTYGWMAYHTRDSRRSDPGFPDLVLVHPEKGLLLFAEVKATDGKVSREQRVWLEGLAAVARAATGPAPAHWPTVYVRCWWPEDLLEGDDVQAVLEGRSEAAIGGER